MTATSATIAAAVVVEAPSAGGAMATEVTLHLVNPRGVQWSGDVVDNEGLGRKKSKSECRPAWFGGAVVRACVCRSPPTQPVCTSACAACS